MKYYNERAEQVHPGMSFTVDDVQLRDSKFLGPKMQVVVHTTEGNTYYMPSSFCRFVANNDIDLNTLIGRQLTIIERETVNGRLGLYVEGDN